MLEVQRTESNKSCKIVVCKISLRAILLIAMLRDQMEEP